jgi:hypothetical protein
MVEFGSGAEQEYVAVIGDVVGSRNTPNREALQHSLVHELDALNGRFREALVSPLALFKGDEVQALIGKASVTVDLVVGLSEAIFPERLSFGLGYGELSTKIDQDVARTDGPCFHRARSALEAAKTDDWLIARGFGPVEDSVLTALFSLMGSIRERWTKKQLAYARAARTMSQKGVAAEFGVVPSTVSQSLKAALFTQVLRGEDAARGLLGQFGRKAESSPNSTK